MLFVAADAANGFPGGKIPVFHYSGGGLIFRPKVTRVLCGKGGDSGGHCGAWCPSVESLGDFKSFQFPGDGCGGSWRPKDIGIYLQRQCAWQLEHRRLQYNEFIVDGDAWSQHLPAPIEAFFQINDGAQADHAAFLNTYHLTPHDVPLVEIDVHNWESPFREARRWGSSG